MPKELPIDPTDPNQEFVTTLAGVPYLLTFRWFARDDAWYLGIYTEEREPIRVGIRVVLGAMLGRRSVDPRFPAGFLFAADTTNTGTEAGVDDLGARVRVYFYTFAEWAEAMAAL